MKVGDVYESENNLKFRIKKITKVAITVEVERVVRRNGLSVIEKHVRDVAPDMFPLFARPYRKISG